MKIDGGAFDFFESIPDEMLTEIAIYDREALERLCIALTLDVQLIIEQTKSKKTKKAKIKN